MIPHESAWFSRACKATSLWVVLCQGTAKGLHLRRQGMCLYMGYREPSKGHKPLIAMRFFHRGIPRKSVCNGVATAQRKRHPLALQRHFLQPSVSRRLRCAREPFLIDKSANALCFGQLADFSEAWFQQGWMLISQ